MRRLSDQVLPWSLEAVISAGGANGFVAYAVASIATDWSDSALAAVQRKTQC